MKFFNTTGPCISSKHYMVNTCEYVFELKKLIDMGKYVSIKRARMYGKTTLLNDLKEFIDDDYYVFTLDFYQINGDVIESENAFSRMVINQILELLFISSDMYSQFVKYIDDEKINLDQLFRIINRCIKKSDKPIVLFIDHVDSIGDNQIFFDFLALLRAGYIGKETDNIPAFKSVVTFGVNDIGYITSTRKDEINSRKSIPWNIATDFNMDMRLSESGIKDMLDEYECDHNTGMNTSEVAKLIREYTNGYPFLVSRICQILDNDEKLKKYSGSVWNKKKVIDTIKLITVESNELFQSLFVYVCNDLELRSLLYRIVVERTNLTWNPDQRQIVQLHNLGIIRKENDVVKIDNRIFENIVINQINE